jgi:GDP-4-dehydro-6-deoxy-D-mannose reductase
VPRALVTGASGFVGRRLLARLARWRGLAPERGGWEIWGLARGRPDAALGEAAPGVRWLALDLAAPGRAAAREVARALGELAPERVFHLAALANPRQCARRPEEAFATQVGGTARLLAALQGGGARVLLASSAAVYGRQPPGPIGESAEPRPDGVYARSKLAAEAVARHFAARGLAVTIARPFNHAGAGQSADYVLPALARELRAARRERRAMRTGNLYPRRDFLHVEDVIDAYLVLIERGPSGGAVNVASGRAHAIGDLLRRLGALDQSTPGLTDTALPALELDPLLARPGEAEELCGDNSALAALGWEPRRGIDELLSELLR